MKPIVEFLSAVTGLPGEHGKVELRLIKDEDVTKLFFSKPEKAVAKALARTGTHVYFGVAPRPTGGSRKDSVVSARVLWADIDRKGSQRLTALQARLSLFPLPPSYVVSTGGGLHAYWLLDDWADTEAIEAANRDIQLRLKSDAVGDITRVMRLPGTMNVKYKPPREVAILEGLPTRVYPIHDVRVASRLSERACQVIHTGDHKGFRSRSERDFAVLAEVARFGGSFDLAEMIFGLNVIGDRVGESGEGYLQRTWEAARKYAEASMDDTGGALEFVPFEDCYYVGDQRVSTFVLEPLGILEGREDYLVCDVHSRGFVWKNTSFPRSAFTKSDALQRHLTILSWQWMGTDKQVRALLVQLVDQLLADGDVPKRKATSVIGMHGDYWVTPQSTISVNGPVEELSYVNVNREAPNVGCNLDIDDDDYRALLVDIVELLPKLNDPEVMAPTMGWFLATPHKPVLDARDLRFPILMLFGTRGSGKTSLIMAFQKMLGYVRPRGYDCATTRFSMLTLMGSTNAVPVSFKEFRESGPGGRQIQRMMRVAYDTGYDVRGRPDQTTVNYPLTAPITLDGEDMPSDPAGLERMVGVCLQPETIKVGSEAYLAFGKFLELPLEMFIGRYVQFCLRSREKFVKAWPQFLDRAHSLTRPVPMTERVANNLAVTFYGVRMFQAFLQGYELKLSVSTEDFRGAMERVFDVRFGRTSLAVDELVASVISEVALHGGPRFAWRYDKSAEVLWFHLRSAYDWWQTTRHRRGMETLGERALQQQLRERRGSDELVGEPKTVKLGKQCFWMYPVDVKLASEALDTPYPLSVGQIILSGAAHERD